MLNMPENIYRKIEEQKYFPSYADISNWHQIYIFDVVSNGD
jgi:hypothetical protein